MDIAALIAAIVAGLSAITTGIMSNRNTRHINAQNISSQWDMYYTNRDYNTLANQALRAREAGFNPHIALGTPVSTSPVNVGIAQPNDYSSFQSLIPNIINSILSTNTYERGNLENEGISLDNLIKELEKEGKVTDNDIKKLQKDIEAVNYQLKLVEQSFMTESASYDLKMKPIEIVQLSQSIQNMAQQFEIGEFEKSIKEAESIIAQLDLEFQLPAYDFRRGVGEVSKYAETIVSILYTITKMVAAGKVKK